MLADSACLLTPEELLRTGSVRRPSYTVTLSTSGRTNLSSWSNESWGRVFPWRERDDAEKKGYTVLGLHANNSDYCGFSTHGYMINLRVDVDLRSNDPYDN